MIKLRAAVGVPARTASLPAYVMDMEITNQEIFFVQAMSVPAILIKIEALM